MNLCFSQASHRFAALRIVRGYSVVGRKRINLLGAESLLYHARSAQSNELRGISQLKLAGKFKSLSQNRPKVTVASSHREVLG